MDARFGSTPVVLDPRYLPVLTSEHLVPLWAEATDRLDALAPSDPQWWRWRTARAALVTALQEAERLAATIEPRLGRRDWAARQVDRPGGGPGPRRPTIPDQARGATR